MMQGRFSSSPMLFRTRWAFGGVSVFLLLLFVYLLFPLHPPSVTRQRHSCSSTPRDLSAVWRLSKTWLQEEKLYPDNPEGLSDVLEAMRCAEVVSADVANIGTQFKFLLTLEGGQKALFKPKWYSRDHVVHGKIYDGKDRHYGEIFAFYLNLVLGFGKTPPAAGRLLHWETDLKPVATAGLLETVFTEGDRTCVVGKCYYCTKAEALCFDPADPVEGTVILWLPEEVKLRKLRSPWARTYKNGHMAKWEYFPKYCKKYVLTSPLFNDHGARGPQSHELFLDFVDAAVFDFLILNGDRHRYELRRLPPPRNATVILMDNGKSFGNPDFPGYDILAPLHQCCYLRRSTWDKLETLAGHPLTAAVDRLASSDLLFPLLPDAQVGSLDKRFAALFTVLDQCFHERGGRDAVLV